MISRETIAEMAQKLGERFAPRKVILFGSHARGAAGARSDVDFLVIAETTLPRTRRSVALYSLLREYPYSKDILVYTPKEVEEYAGLPGSLVAAALRDGVVLYEG